MGKAGTSPITADMPVPHTKGAWTYGQLCNVKRVAGQIKPGTVLAYHGAWDRKAVVTHVVYEGIFNTPTGPNHVFTIGIQRLGNFYATGKMVPSKAEVSEIQVETNNGRVGGYRFRHWHPVDPFSPDKRWHNPDLDVHNHPAGEWAFRQTGEHELIAQGDEEDFEEEYPE